MKNSGLILDSENRKNTSGLNDFSRVELKKMIHSINMRFCIILNNEILYLPHLLKFVIRLNGHHYNY